VAEHVFRFSAVATLFLTCRESVRTKMHFLVFVKTKAWREILHVFSPKYHNFFQEILKLLFAQTFLSKISPRTMIYIKSFIFVNRRRQGD
jgi:hypothetical protein